MKRLHPTHRIDPFDLRLFAAVVDEGSITAGARQVHLSLAAASTRLQNLEHAVGAVLLHRSKQGVTPTDAGHTLMRHAGRLRRDLESMHADMAAHAHGVRNTVRLVCNTAAMTDHLPPVIGRFLAQHPDVDIDLREFDSQDVLQAMRQERADIGIVADHVGAEGLTTHPFGEDELVVLQAAAAASTARRALRFVDLLDTPFVGLPADSGLSRFLQGRALHHGRGLHHRVRVRSLDAVVQLVADGVGIAIVPRVAAVRLANPGVHVLGLEDTWATRRLLLCTPRAVTLGAGAAQLLGYLRKTAGPASPPEVDPELHAAS